MSANTFTWGQILTKLQNDLDLQDMDFVQTTEILGYANEAIRDAETTIHTLGLEARYFLATDTLTITNGTADYTMPSDIFADKMVKVLYVNGSVKYEVYRIRNLTEIPFIQTGEDYRYLIMNLSSGVGVRQRLFPTPAETGAYIQRYYIREVNQLTSDTVSATNVCEIPECINFLYARVREKIYEKEGSPLLAKAQGDLKVQYDLMTQTLQEMVPDQNDWIRPDLSFYEDLFIDPVWRT